MLKSIAVLGLAAAMSALSFASTSITGSLTWAHGTLVSAVTVSDTPQTIKVDIGGSVLTLDNTVVVGVAGSIIGPGSTFEVLEKGSVPFAGTFSATTALARSSGSVASSVSWRSVQIDSAGTLLDNIGFAGTDGTNLELMLPNFKVGSYEFLNGMTITMNTELKGFALNLPNIDVPTIGGISFPTTSIPLNTFRLVATGTSSLTMTGTSTTSGVRVAGVLSGKDLLFTSARLDIQSGTGIL